MEWQQLEYFQIVASLQHMTRAAEALSVSQPALSRSISRLESELGVQLFERQGRAIILNSYGEIFLKRVNRIMKEFNEGKQELQDLLDPEYGKVSLGFLHTLGTHIIPDLIGAFRAEHPKVKFQLNQNSTQSLLGQLEAGETDLCMVSYSETKLAVKWVDLLNEELFVIVPQEHELADRDSIDLREIATESLISFKQGYGLRMITDQLYQQAGIVPQITFEGDEVPTIAGLVAAGLGIAILPDIKGLGRNNLVQVSVKWPKCERSIKLAWVEGRYLSPAVKQFRQFVLHYFQEFFKSSS